MTKTTQLLTNLEIAKLLRKIAAAYTITGENRFKVIAYDNAATAVEHATSELKDLWEENELDSIPGLGPSIQSHLDELFKTGKSKHFDSVLRKVNPAIFTLLEIPGLGPKKAQKLVEELNIKSTQDVVEQLEKAAINHKISSIETFGTKSEQDILENIARYRKGQIKEKRMLLSQADLIAGEIISYLKDTCPEAKRIETLGSLRRRVDTVGDLDFAVATKNFEEVIDAFINFPKKVSLIERGPTGASILLASGRQADLRVAKPAEYGAMLQYFTGSKYHNIRLRDYALTRKLSLNEYGITDIKNPASPASARSEPAGRQISKSKNTTQKSNIKKFAYEESLYNFLGLNYIPPELREDRGEVEAAFRSAQGKLPGLPDLIKLTDIKGDLHTHSNYDLKPSHDFGTDSMGDMIITAKSLGYEYFAFAEHNPKTSGLSSEGIVRELESRKDYIEQLRASTKSIQIISLLEVDIHPDGQLATPDAGLEQLDAAIVSIHSSFRMDRKMMTERVLRGLGNPAAKILAHPTGRLLDQREGYELDWQAVFKFCLDNDKALEINAHPSRLDLSDTLTREAVNAGVKLVIDTDSHNKEGLVNMRYGISVARRGWVEAKTVINTWKFAQLISWLKKR